MKQNVLIYVSKNGKVKVDVNINNDDAWMSQELMAKLYDTTKNNISMHLKNIFKEGELNKDSVVKKFLTTASDGKKYNVIHYNLDAIIAVGYRINSKKATEFRIWATKVLKEYMIKGEYPTKSEVEIAKNYLKEEELDKLNRMVSAYLDVAEINALDRHPMTMQDWVNELDMFLTMTRKDILKCPGIISHKQALKKAHEEYDKYMKNHLTKAEKDYLDVLNKDISELHS